MTYKLNFFSTPFRSPIFRRCLVILLGVTLTMVILALIHSLGALAPLRGGPGAILIGGVLATLVATLGREVMRAENK